ncbi:MAG TPA: glycosyltransferase family 4 protein [Polyangia bacterium]|jgi:glycosyltransferase involved in cell wall biosynthesis
MSTSSGLRIALALPGLHRVNRGAETAMERIAAGLANLGHVVTVFGSGPERAGAPYRYRRIFCVPRERFESWPQVPILRSHYAWEELTFSVGLAAIYRPGDYDVTMACSYPFINWVFRRGRPKHVFVTQNGDWAPQARNSEFRLFSCDGLVCTNSQYFARNRERFRSVLIPNGVDPDVFFPGAGDRAAYDLPADKSIALMVSALIPSKRVSDGVRAVAATEGMFLAVAGDGECRTEVDELAAKLLPGRFRRFNLPREKMPGLYRCADLFLHMSVDEPSANAYMEALSTGLPIVTHDWEVTRWTLEDCGLMVDSHELELVTAALQRALQLRRKEDEQARRALVDRRFAWSHISEAYSEFLHQVLAG